MRTGKFIPQPFHQRRDSVVTENRLELRGEELDPVIGAKRRADDQAIERDGSAARDNGVDLVSIEDNDISGLGGQNISADMNRCDAFMKGENFKILVPISGTVQIVGQRRETKRHERERGERILYCMRFVCNHDNLQEQKSIKKEQKFMIDKLTRILYNNFVGKSRSFVVHLLTIAQIFLRKQ